MVKIEHFNYVCPGTWCILAKQTLKKSLKKFIRIQNNWQKWSLNDHLHKKLKEYGLLKNMVPWGHGHTV